MRQVMRQGDVLVRPLARRKRTGAPVTDYASAKRADTARYGRYFHAMLERGVYLAPSQFEAAFVSLAHTEQDLDTAAAAAAEAVALSA